MRPSRGSNNAIAENDGNSGADGGLRSKQSTGGLTKESLQPATASQQEESAKPTRLVFGLSSRTNRLKHDEYAEQRIRASQVSPKQAVSLKNQQQVPFAIRIPDNSDTKLGKLIPQEQSASNEKPKVVKQSTIRASKYGNFYKPQDLVASNSNQSPQHPPPPTSKPSTTVAVSCDSSAKSVASDQFWGENKTINLQSDQQLQHKHKMPSTEIQTTGSCNSTTTTTTTTTTDTTTTTTTAANKQRLSRSKSPQRKGNSTRSSSGGRTRSKSPASSKKSSPETNSNLNSNSTLNTKNSIQPTVAELGKQEIKVKMQFNVPPPPPITSNSSRGSVVSYAKSRIYDKPARVAAFNSNNLKYNGSSVLDYNSNIPESILCGFKPPKQINVSKAREKWEGGEPFAKCKSRQRLAAQAGKKMLGGTWSMTSVVATQQLQFQQALAAASSFSRLSSSSLSNLGNQSEKVLSRGSVLERVQQFEKIPPSKSSSSSSEFSSSNSTTSTSTTTSSTSSSSFNSKLNDVELELNSALDSDEDKIRLRNKALSLAIESELNSKEEDNNDQTSNKENLSYRSRVSSIQNKQLQAFNLVKTDQINLNSKQQINKSSATSSPRRLSLRRRSSTSNSSFSVIPKFYHPNGKPNTYEMELQKKNIVSCFDKFPDRKALLSGPNCRRHFHSIALACNFSEYFKEPLCLYVKHKLLNSNLLVQAASNGSSKNSTLSRKQSNAGYFTSTMEANNYNLDSCSIQSNGEIASHKKLDRNLLQKSASIDNSTVEKIQNQNFISCDQFLIIWKNIISSAYDQAAQFVHLLTMNQRNYLLPDDFIPLIQSIIEEHPGLKFLKDAPDFHMRYIQTVIARIYYHINKSWTGKISLNELRRSNLLSVLQVLSKEEDINQVTDYFSYEHFYVIYCKFWNLDQDHDLLISKEDLARHNDAAISSRIIDRIFMGIVSKQIQVSSKMSYSDFVWFLMAEEDKKHPRAIEYWFRLMDIDGDGYISMYEMEYFYYEQQKRLELMNIEALPFIDSACQILDLVNPKEKNKISLSDLKRTKMATIFFDTFINLEKYLEHESREFVSTRDIVQDGVVISDWDRYASEEYENLVTEETSV